MFYFAKGLHNKENVVFGRWLLCDEIYVSSTSELTYLVYNSYLVAYRSRIDNRYMQCEAHSVIDSQSVR